MNNILITGAHRSGTTWLGEVFRRLNGYNYFYEPFNPRGKVANVPMINQYENITKNSSINRKNVYYKYLDSYRSVNYGNLQDFLKKSPTLKIAIKGVVKELTKPFFKKMIFKDPLALLAAEWIYNNFNSKVIIIVRHPCAVVESHKSRGWRFSFNHLLNQDDLKEELEPFMDRINKLSNTEDDCIERAAIWWAILNKRVLSYLNEFSENKNWVFVSHEFLLQSPENNFKTLFKKLDLVYSKKVERFINKSTTLSKRNESNLVRNHEELIHKWKRKLSKEEQSLVIEVCGNTYQSILDNSKFLDK
ncbi:MAG: hypothetical protein CMC96_01555 [Flavobacteriales bacterium]|nr:hypothetical protein [Flavobacteriales bacterium]|tara:strand:+ start:17149 stop:18060 length:912 start_codon:yes stop_codon:yes gene_type:complete